MMSQWQIVVQDHGQLPSPGTVLVTLFQYIEHCKLGLEKRYGESPYND